MKVSRYPGNRRDPKNPRQRHSDRTNCERKTDSLDTTVERAPVERRIGAPQALCIAVPVLLPTVGDMAVAPYAPAGASKYRWFPETVISSQSKRPPCPYRVSAEVIGCGRAPHY